MGTYPNQYSEAAIVVAETIVRKAAAERLLNIGSRWIAEPYFLSNEEFESIKCRFAPGVANSDVLRFIGLVFSKTKSIAHFKFTKEGYRLALNEDEHGCSVILSELPRSAFIR